MPTFRPGVVAALLLVGAAAFILLLLALGKGWTGDNTRNGGEHASSNALNGFSGLARLLEADGYVVELSRNPGAFEEYGLLILTPPHFANGNDIAEAIKDHRDYGPTLLILPKWNANLVPDNAPGKLRGKVKQGWVTLGEASQPYWFHGMDWEGELEDNEGGMAIQVPVAPDAEGDKKQTKKEKTHNRLIEVAIGETNAWNFETTSGKLARPDVSQALLRKGEQTFYPVIVDSEGDMLLAEWDGGDASDYLYPVYVAFEPDLFNNYGLADFPRAQLAFDVIAELDDNENLPILFDLTFPGLGSSENLLTLAFEPPFLAATLSLILVAILIAWRGLRRFGPPRAEAPAMARGKRQLARNGAALIARLKRWHLLSAPYALSVAARIATALGIRDGNREAREAAIDRALERRGYNGTGFAETAHSLRQAQAPRDIIRAARALKSLERELQR